MHPIGSIIRVPLAIIGIALTLAFISACQSQPGYTGDAQALAQLSQQPLPSTSWQFGQHSGLQITTAHYHIFTTIDDGLYDRLLVRVLEAAYARGAAAVPQAAVNRPLDCYVFGSRSQWEAYTKVRAGSNAPIYLQISAGGYCQEGVFAGYDIGRDQTLSVIAHEAWHQFSWFAFKDRLPSWLEEGLATQNEGIEWEGTTPRFRSELNYRRFLALKDAIRENRLWKISDLVATHAGKVIKMPQKHIDSYYAQLWSLVLFLKSSPTYAPRLQTMLNDAGTGKLTRRPRRHRHHHTRNRQLHRTLEHRRRPHLPQKIHHPRPHHPPTRIRNLGPRIHLHLASQTHHPHHRAHPTLKVAPS